MDIFKFKRMYGDTDLFNSLITSQDPELVTDSGAMLDQIFTKHQKEIFDEKHAVNTSIVTLISAYKKAGNGVIKTAVRCDNEEQKEYIQSIAQSAHVFVSSRKDVDMSKYGRLVVGNYLSALEYTLNNPKSILVLNFKENFDNGDSRLLNPELIISLGDIHDIEVIHAFRDEDIKTIKG